MSQKIVTILGTRPELIRLSCVIPLLDKYCSHTFIHTGQNYTHELNKLFFEELKIREPDEAWDLGERRGFDQIGEILRRAQECFERLKPDKLVLLGDTNSALVAMVAKRMGIEVYHMEAGNRCYDDRVPEEVNRRIIDHSSDILLPYTHRSKENLYKEGFPHNRVYVTGNPILEVLEFYAPQIDSSTILKELGVSAKEFFLVTLHRSENVDDSKRLEGFFNGLIQLNKEHNKKVFVSTHPRTREKLDQTNFSVKNLADQGIVLMNPLGFFNFVHLEKNAFCVLSDSGTVQEECCLFGTPNITLRDVTERPETFDCGSNFLSGVDTQKILEGTRLATSSPNNWKVPEEYQSLSVAEKVVRIILSYR